MAAPSANLSSQPSPVTASPVIDAFYGAIDAILDGGKTAIGTPSTILSLAGERPELIRAGCAAGVGAEGAAGAMKVIGICGGSGSGKTEALRILAADGMPTLNCDAVSRQVMQPGSVCCRELCEAFGTELLREDGSLDRRRLFALTFNDPEKLQTLNRITHFHILRPGRCVARSAPLVARPSP